MMKKVLITGIILLVVILAQAELQEVSGAAKTDLRSAGNYYRQKVFDKALGFYEKVLEANPYHIESLYNVAGIFYEIEKEYATAYNYYIRTLNSIDLVYQEYEELMLSDEKAAGKYHKKYIKGEDLEKKQELATTLLSNCWTLLYQKGYDLYMETKYEVALEKLEKLYEMAPDSVLTVKMIGNSYMMLDNNEKAIEYYELASELEPDNEKNAQLIANKYFQLENRQDAVAWYEKAAKINPENPDNYFNMGICYTDLGKKEKALEMFVKTLEYEENNIDAIHNAKIIALQLDDLENYLRFSRMEFEITGYNVDALRVLCSQLISLEAYEAVLEFGEKWSELDPQDPVPYQLMYLAADRLGRSELAAKYQKILSEIE
jgi:tetratricopeptide (TPR) repeat protein